MSAGFSQWQMLSLTNDGLVTYRRVGGLAGSTLVPDLATSLPAPTDNGRTYTFQLRSRIHYSDGTLVEPQDLLHEFVRVYRLGNEYAESLESDIVGAKRCMLAPRRCTFAGGIVANDQANTITFHLTRPDPDFLYKLTFPWTYAVPSTTPFRDLGRSVPPATGPYVTKSISLSHQPGPPGHGQLAFHTWVLARNPRFREWNPAAQPPGYPDRIELTDDGSPVAAAAAVAQNRLDVLVSVPYEPADRFRRPLHGALPLRAGRSVLHAGHEHPAAAEFNRVDVRRALNFAIDRRRIIAFAGGSLAAQPTCQILPPNIPGAISPIARTPGIRAPAASGAAGLSPCPAADRCIRHARQQGDRSRAGSFRSRPEHQGR